MAVAIMNASPGAILAGVGECREVALSGAFGCYCTVVTE